MSLSLNKDLCIFICIFIYCKVIIGGKISFKFVFEKRKINIDVYRNNDVLFCLNSKKKKLYVILMLYIVSDCKKIKLFD